MPAEIENDSDTPRTDIPGDDRWLIAGMMPIAVAHAEAAARAAGISIGEWLSQLIVESTLAPANGHSSSSTTTDAVKPARDDRPRLR